MTEAVIGLIGVIVGSIIVISKDVWISRLERRRQGSYSAIRLICILEEYADKCVEVVFDDGTAFGRPAGQTESGEEYCVVQVNAPEPIEYPEDIVWPSLTEALMHRTLALTNKARSTDRQISASSENAFPPNYKDLFWSRQKGYARLGLDALEIADELRIQFEISVKSRADLNSDWNPKAYLGDRLTEFDKKPN